MRANIAIMDILRQEKSSQQPQQQQRQENGVLFLLVETVSGRLFSISMVCYPGCQTTCPICTLPVLEPLPLFDVIFLDTLIKIKKKLDQ